MFASPSEDSFILCQILSILNTLNEEAVCVGKMRMHYNIETQKPRQNNLDLFSLAGTETLREQLTLLNSTVNIKLHG